jgi:hypothetical protein
MLAALPLLALPVVVYNLIVAFLIPSGFKSHGYKAGEALEQMARPLFHIPTTTGGEWPVGAGDLLVFGSLVLLFVELLKATTSRSIAIINHSLSMVLFITCLIEFLLFPAFATPSFFLLTSMVLLDVLAGFIVTIAATKREIDFRS